VKNDAGGADGGGTGTVPTMTTTTDPTWWQEQHAYLQQCAETGDGAAGPPFSAPLLDLLADVEHAFAVTGADTPPWPDPHLGPGGRDVPVREEEYSRCLDPGKYRIVVTRAEAWAPDLPVRCWDRMAYDVTG